MTADDIAPLCHCGGICVKKTQRPNFRGALVSDQAVCLRCGSVLGNWYVIMERCLEERKDER